MKNSYIFFHIRFSPLCLPSPASCSKSRLKLTTFIIKIVYFHYEKDFKKGSGTSKRPSFCKIILSGSLLADLRLTCKTIVTLSNLVYFSKVNVKKILTDPQKTLVHCGH